LRDKVKWAMVRSLGLYSASNNCKWPHKTVRVTWSIPGFHSGQPASVRVLARGLQDGECTENPSYEYVKKYVTTCNR
jgi:hypothetical protein